MKRFVPLSVVAGALACFVLAGSAQAAPATNGILGKLAAETYAANQVEKVGWRRRTWRRRCFRRCMWRTDRPRFCRRSCYRRSWRWGWGRGWRY